MPRVESVKSVQHDLDPKLRLEMRMAFSRFAGVTEEKIGQADL